MCIRYDLDCFFRVRGCSDAQIDLKRLFTDDFAVFQIKIGHTDGNVHLNITNNDNTEYHYESVNLEEPLLSCTDFKKYWLKWADGYFYFGRGSANTETLVGHIDDYGPRTFETLHLRNAQGSTNVIEWEFADDIGMFCLSCFSGISLKQTRFRKQCTCT